MWDGWLVVYTLFNNSVLSIKHVHVIHAKNVRTNFLSITNLILLELEFNQTTKIILRLWFSFKIDLRLHYFKFMFIITDYSVYKIIWTINFVIILLWLDKVNKGSVHEDHHYLFSI